MDIRVITCIHIIEIFVEVSKTCLEIVDYDNLKVLKIFWLTENE